MLQAFSQRPTALYLVTGLQLAICNHRQSPYIRKVIHRLHTVQLDPPGNLDDEEAQEVHKGHLRAQVYQAQQDCYKFPGTLTYQELQDYQRIQEGPELLGYPVV